MTVKSIMQLQLLRLMIGLKVPSQFINQWEEKPSRSRLHRIAMNLDWFNIIVLFAPAVIGLSNSLVFVLQQSVEDRSNW